MAVEIRREDPRSPLAATLVDEAARELAARYDLPALAGFELADALHGGAFVIAWRDGCAVGCGALRALAPGVSEVKRMYVRPTARGMRVGAAILRALEHEARALGVHTLRLETGDRQPDAVRLYEREGFIAIPCFAPYAGQPWSRCFEKRLPADEES